MYLNNIKPKLCRIIVPTISKEMQLKSLKKTGLFIPCTLTVLLFSIKYVYEYMENKFL